MQSMEELEDTIREAIDEAFSAVRTVLESDTPDFKFSGDDKAEELVAAITKYYLESRR